ncbi:MAG: CRISPR system precrRNA processing endoribonuclease RAMP protein Cas6 [Butyrivibrio sp.]|nr:CRISPR system precrRNA processing endoribonuclease RAMP protein Cas6 [Butyrivibrio sp.]
MYFKQFLNAFYMLGQAGLGKEKSQFSIVAVTNTEGAFIFQHDELRMNEYRTRKVSDYVSYRKEKLSSEDQIKIVFKTPLTIKYRGENLCEFRPDALIEALSRRIYMLDCFEGIDSGIHELDYVRAIVIPTTLYESHKKVSVRRYSNHKRDAMRLEGIEGELALKEVSEELLEMLIAGELIHVGKNTSFGFGRYRIS